MQNFNPWIVEGPDQFQDSELATQGFVFAYVLGLLGNLSGPTEDRPLSPYPGQFFFDTTLGQPVWWSATDWVNAAGAQV